MKKSIFTLALILSVAIIFAQCTPDGSTAVGLRPSSSSVSCVIKGQPFSQDYTIGVWSTVTMSNQQLNVQSLEIMSITNLPSGLSASFAVTPHVYAVGEQACFRISGTTSAACGQYLMKIRVKINVGVEIETDMEAFSGNPGFSASGYSNPFLRVITFTDQCPSVNTSQTSPFVAYNTCGLPDPVVSTDAASSIGNNAATLNGTVDANGNNATVNFEWGLTTSYGQSGAATPSSLNTSVATPVSKTISGLIADTVYHYRVKVIYLGGGPTYGSDQQFFIAAHPAPNVTTEAPSNITQSSAKLNGSVNANGNTVDIDFEWGTTTGYGNTNAATPPTLNTTVSTPVNTFLFGLNNNTTYHYRTKVSYLSFTEYGSDQQFTTGTTGIEETDALALRIYPNPAQRELTIETETSEPAMIAITNSLGETVKTIQITGAGTQKIDVSEIPKGIYTVTLTSEGYTKAGQVIIVHDK